MVPMADPQLSHRGGDAHVLVLDGQEQSFVDLADPTRLAFDYVRRLGAAVDLCFPPGERIRITHVGGAAMTLPRYVATTRKTSPQIVLEPDEHVVALTRDLLPLPPRSGIKVRTTDGRTGVTTLPTGSQDAVVVDAFAQGRVPGNLVTAEFFDEIARVLAPGGVLMLNLVDHRPFGWTRSVIAGIRPHFGHLATSADPSAWKARRGGNLVLLASRRPLPVSGWRGRDQKSGTPSRVLDDRATRDALGGGVPFTDEWPQDSPAP